MMFAARISSLALALLFAVSASAAEVKVGDLAISDAWARASVVKNGAAYVTIMNHGREADRLIAAATPVAKKVELHTHVMDGDIVRMRRVAGFEVAAQSHTVLKPGGMHIMLMGLKQPLKEGEMVPLTLTFEKAGSVELMAHVRKAGEMGHGAGHTMGEHGKKQTH